MSAGRAKRAANRRRKEAPQHEPTETTRVAGPSWFRLLLGLCAVLLLVWGLGSWAGMVRRSANLDRGDPRSGLASEHPTSVLPKTAPRQYIPPTTFDGLKEESFQSVDRFLQRFPNDIEGIAKAAQLAGIFGEKELAKQYWQRCVDLRPVHMHARYALAWLAMHDADYTAMADYARRALAFAPHDPKFRDLLGYALTEMGELDEAVAVLEGSVERGIANCDTYTLLGKVHLLSRKYPQAVRYFEQAVREDPNWSKALYGLATANNRLGDRVKAKNAFERFQQTQTKVVVQSSEEQLFAARHDVGLIYGSLSELYDLHGDRESAAEMQYRSTQFQLAASESHAESLHHMSGRISGGTSQ